MDSVLYLAINNRTEWDTKGYILVEPKGSEQNKLFLFHSVEVPSTSYIGWHPLGGQKEKSIP